MTHLLFARHILAVPLFLGLLALNAPLAQAETTASMTENGRKLLSFAVPDFWTLRSGGQRALSAPDDAVEVQVPRVLSMTPTVDPTVWMGFLSPPGVRNLEEARAYLRDIGPHLAFEPQMNAATSRRIAGRQAEVLSGTGRRYGKPIQFSIAIIPLPANRVAIASAVIEGGTDPAFFDQVNAVFGSIRVGQ